MAQEIELKLSVPPDAIDEVARLPWLREATNGPVTRQRLVSTYFDTAKQKLRRRGVSLRVRQVGGERVQTIKVTRKGGCGALGRGEWEAAIDGDTPDLSLAKDTALAPLLKKRLRRKLHPVFETIVERVTLPVRAGKTAMEVAVDHGRIEADGRHEPISEVEIELKRGDALEVMRLAGRLARSLPLAYHPRAKQDRGYALVSDDATGPVRAAPVALDPRSSKADAFRVVALACLDHALSNERAVAARVPEGVHQMRVGLRRLRAALSLFKGLVRGPSAETVKTELTWLTDQLGPARELDVLIDERVEPARKTASFAEVGALAADLDGRRSAALDKAAAAVGSERYRALGLDVAMRIVDGAWTRGGGAERVEARERAAAETAAEILAKRLKKIVKRARRLDKLSPGRRHKLRIAAKKLRYGAGFFATLFPGGKSAKRQRRFVKALKGLQSALGTLNDFEAHKGVARSIAHPSEPSRKQPQKALAIGFVTGEEQAQTRACLDAAAGAADRLRDTRAFWK